MQSKGADLFQPTPLSRPESSQAIRQQDQAVSASRDALWQACSELPRIHPTRVNKVMAARFMGSRPKELLRKLFSRDVVMHYHCIGCAVGLSSGKFLLQFQRGGLLFEVFEQVGSNKLFVASGNILDTQLIVQPI
jgi:hypothetical protein